MHTSLPAPLKPKQHSDAVQGKAAKNKTVPLGLMDNRTVAKKQRTLAEMINNSPRVLQQQALSDAIHSSPRMVAQARKISSLIGGTVQLHDEGAIPAQLSPVQREDELKNSGLPNQLKSGIASLSGLSMDHVKVHYNSNKPAQLQAHAYAQGSEIHVALGQERNLPHEAWHIVQQAQGRVRPTMQMKGEIAVNDDVGLENEATAMGEKAMQMQKAKPELTSKISPNPPLQTMAAKSVFQFRANKRNRDNGVSEVHAESPIQFMWTKTKLDDYKAHLRRRAARRKEKGKNKNSNKLLHKYMNARRHLDPDWVPRLADAPTAGHHVPPLAASNALNGMFAFGARGSSQEKKRERLYLHGSADERREQHWMMHEAEGLQGINRNNGYDGDDEEELAIDMVRAHKGLTRLNGTRLTAEVLSQHDKAKGESGDEEDLGNATRRIMEEQADMEINSVDSDTTTSDPDSDTDNWKTDSDSDSD